MDADRGREQQQHDERQTRERVAEDLAAVTRRNDRVPHDVRAHDPKIDERMAEVPEEEARHHDVDAGRPSHGPRNQKAHFRDDADRGDDPHQERGCRQEDRQRQRLSGMLLAEIGDVLQDFVGDDPGAGDQNRCAEIEERTCLKRGVERVEHGRVAHKNRHGGHRRADEHDGPTQPSGGRLTIARNGTVGDEERESGDEERREDERHQHAVQRQDAIVVEPGRSRDDAGARKALKNAEDRSQADRGGRGVEMRDDDPVFGAHRLHGGHFIAPRSFPPCLDDRFRSIRCRPRSRCRACGTCATSY